MYHSPRMDLVQRGAHFDGVAHGFIGGNRTSRQSLGKQFAGNRFFTEEIQSRIRHVGCSFLPNLGIPRHNSHGHLNFIIRGPGDNTPLVTTEVLGVLDAVLQRPNRNVRARTAASHRDLPSAILWVAPIDTAGGACTIQIGTYFHIRTEVTQNVESQEDPARILP